ncbi:hypothetical protein CEXT_684331 [Caerostris extrusa]|uniref:Uncharacterized protein n=1 Tax=Caerostris extrusa TaxID=172846 RepID=A0AAV4XBR4_CAEEX|nr:hypothetical protein CEXT_684331 [Caerostris extrusa]
MNFYKIKCKIKKFFTISSKSRLFSKFETDKRFCDNFLSAQLFLAPLPSHPTGREENFDEILQTIIPGPPPETILTRADFLCPADKNKHIKFLVGRKEGRKGGRTKRFLGKEKCQTIPVSPLTFYPAGAINAPQTDLWGHR